MERNPWIPREEYLLQKREGTIAPKEKVNPCVDLIDLLRKIQDTDNDARSISFISSLMQQNARGGGISLKQDEIARQIAVKYGVIEGELPPEETYDFDTTALLRKIKLAGGTNKDIDFCISVGEWIESGNALTRKQFESLKRIEERCEALESERRREQESRTARREEQESRYSRREEQEIDPYSISKQESESDRRAQSAARDRDDLGQLPRHSESESVSPWRAKWMAADRAYNQAKSIRSKEAVNSALMLLAELDVTRPDIYAKIAELEQIRDGARIKKNPSKSQQAEYDREVEAYNKQFKKMNAARKRDGLPQVQTSFGGSWAHEQDFRKRMAPLNKNTSIISGSIQARNKAESLGHDLGYYSDIKNGYSNECKKCDATVRLDFKGTASGTAVTEKCGKARHLRIVRNPKREINPMNLSPAKQAKYNKELAAYNKRNPPSRTAVTKNPFLTQSEKRDIKAAAIRAGKSVSSRGKSQLIDIHRAIKAKMRKS